MAYFLNIKHTDKSFTMGSTLDLMVAEKYASHNKEITETLPTIKVPKLDPEKHAVGLNE